MRRLLFVLLGLFMAAAPAVRAYSAGDELVGTPAPEFDAIEWLDHDAAIFLRVAVRRDSPMWADAFSMGVDREAKIVRHVEVDETVSVRFEKRRARSPAAISDTHIRFAERAIAVVAKKKVLAESGHDEIDVAVVVDVGRGAAHAVAVTFETGGLRDIEEAAASHISVERIGRRRIAVPGKGGAVHEIEIG